MVVNPSVRRSIFRLWNQFCEFTSIAGLRFLTSKVSLHVRIAAYIVFIGSLCGLDYQIGTLIMIYLRGEILTTTLKRPSEDIPLPIVYFCALLENKTMSKFPFFEACSKNATSNEFFHRQIDKCDYRVASAKFLCDFQCKWTSNGYCVELRRGGPSSDDDNNLLLNNIVEDTNKSPSDFDIEINYPTTEPHASVYLHSPHDPMVNTSAVPLIGAPHMVIMPVALNFIEVYEILQVQSFIQVRRQDTFEMCAWRRYNELYEAADDCSTRLYASLHPPQNESEGEELFLTTDCGFQLAERAMEKCQAATVVTRFVVECAVGDGADQRNSIDNNTYNVRIFASETVTRLTESRRDRKEYKTLSDIGSTLTLFIGFTLMSLLEAGAFFSVPGVRRDAQQDEDTLMERKNPPIKFPLPLPERQFRALMVKVREKLNDIRQKRAKTATEDEVTPWESPQPNPTGWKRFLALVSRIRALLERQFKALMAKVRQKLDDIRQKRAGTAKNDVVSPWETTQPKPTGWFGKRFSPLVSKIRQNLPSLDFAWVPQMGRGMIQKLLYIWKRKTGIMVDQVQPVEVRPFEEMAPPPLPELAQPLAESVTAHVPQ